MSDKKYTSDLDGFIKNMKDVEKQAKDNSDTNFGIVVGFAVKLAEEFKSKCKPKESSILDDLEGCDCMGEVSKLLRQYGR